MRATFQTENEVLFDVLGRWRDQLASEGITPATPSVQNSRPVRLDADKERNSSLWTIANLWEEQFSMHNLVPKPPLKRKLHASIMGVEKKQRGGDRIIFTDEHKEFLREFGYV